MGSHGAIVAPFIAKGQLIVTTNEQARVLPMYIVIDESLSMSGVMDQLNSALEGLIEKVRLEPFASSKARLSVLGFSDDGMWHMELENVSNLESIPELHARNSTSYAAVFECLESRIPNHVTRLNRDGYAVHRPAVFFLSDGQPNYGEEWETILDRLNELHARPNIFAFGFGNADPAVIESVATERPDSKKYAWMASGDMDPAAAISEFIEVLTHSIIASARAADEGKTETLLKEPTGFIPIDTGLV